MTAATDVKRPRNPGWKTAGSFLVLGFLAGLFAAMPTYWLFGLSDRHLPPTRVEATIHLPTADNTGAPFERAVWDGTLDRLARDFGGFTLGPEREGGWRDDAGNVRREPIRLVTVTFAPEKLPEFRAACGEIAKTLRQDVLYVRYEQPRVDLVSVPR